MTKAFTNALRLEVGQAGLPIANFANYAKLLRDFQFEQRVGNSIVVREPVGVIRDTARQALEKSDLGGLSASLTLPSAGD